MKERTLGGAVDEDALVGELLSDSILIHWAFWASTAFRPHLEFMSLPSPYVERLIALNVVEIGEWPNLYRLTTVGRSILPKLRSVIKALEACNGGNDWRDA